jgi:hypothetical protein
LFVWTIDSAEIVSMLNDAVLVHACRRVAGRPYSDRFGATEEHVATYDYRGYTIQTQCTHHWVAFIHSPSGGFGFHDPLTGTIQEGEDVAIERAKQIIDRVIDKEYTR